MGYAMLSRHMRPAVKQVEPEPVEPAVVAEPLVDETPAPKKTKAPKPTKEE